MAFTGNFMCTSFVRGLTLDNTIVIIDEVNNMNFHELDSIITRIGENCRIHVCTNIGASNKSNKAPIIGDNVYIGPGVKMYGGLTIASNIKIAPNSAVSKSFIDENVIIGGIPASVIK